MPTVVTCAIDMPVPTSMISVGWSAAAIGVPCGPTAAAGTYATVEPETETSTAARVFGISVAGGRPTTW